jgi:hypothetical protein
MTFNINEFSSNIGKWGVAKPSHFQVIINKPQSLQLQGFESGDIASHLGFRCETAELPGRSATTTEAFIYGPQTKQVYGSLYDDISFTFLSSANMREKVFFEQWIEYATGTDSVYIRNSGFNVKYHDDYVTDMEVYQYSADGTPTYGIRLIDAFPIAVPSIPLNRASTDEIHRVTVNVSYKMWERLPTWKDRAYKVKQVTGLFGNFGGYVGAATAFAGGPATQRAIGLSGVLLGGLL